jgi:fibronectin type 3 domain-containing protein
MQPLNASFPRTLTTTQALRTALVGLLAAVFMAAAAGCGGAGANGGDDDDGDQTVVPAAPTGLEATPTNGEISLSWDASDNAESYNVYRATESGVETTDPVAEGRTGTTYADTDVENGTTYFYVVTAVADEEGDPSSETEGTPFAAPSALAGTSEDAQIQLGWSGGAGAEAYNVYRSERSTDGASGDPLASGVSSTSYTDESAENGTTYYYRVTSVNPEDAESSASNEVEKTPFSDPPNRPE